jgi:hypothetical protein
MTKHYIQLTPYFRSDAYQESFERKIEKSIEDKCKSVLCLLTKIWKHTSDSSEKSKDLSERLGD